MKLLLAVFAFLLLLLAIATGPIGLAVIFMIGVPFVLFAGAEGMAHNHPRGQ